jgi:gas vesicle protein
MGNRDSGYGIGAFMMGFFMGSLLGATVALLLAPQSGEDMRILLKDKADEALVKAEAAATEAKTRYDDIAKMTMERLGAEEKEEIAAEEVATEEPDEDTTEEA